MKRKLRFFCDYCADSPLWESFDNDIHGWPEDEYNKSKESLSKFGVRDGTILLMDALMFIYEWPRCDEELTEVESATFMSLQSLILSRLQNEIGDEFEIEVID